MKAIPLIVLTLWLAGLAAVLLIDVPGDRYFVGDVAIGFLN